MDNQTFKDMLSHKGKKVHNYTLIQKLSVIQDLDQGLDKSTAAKKHNVPRWNIQRWWKERQKLRTLQSELSVKMFETKKRMGGGGRHIVSPDLEDHMVYYIYQLRAKQLRVTRRVILREALSQFQLLQGNGKIDINVKFKG
jgi:hypothetical protein